jgi:hypothetical protein
MRGVLHISKPASAHFAVNAFNFYISLTVNYNYVPEKLGVMVLQCTKNLRIHSVTYNFIFIFSYEL